MPVESMVSGFLLPLVACAVAHLASSLAAWKGAIPRAAHRTFWNLLLAASFLLCAATGFLLGVKALLPDLGPIVRLHDQSGAILLACGAGHAAERWRWFAAKARSALEAARRGRRQWPQVGISVAALSLLLALPSILAEVVASRGDAPAATRRIPSASPLPGASAAPALPHPGRPAPDAESAAPSRDGDRRTSAPESDAKPAKIAESDRLFAIGDLTANPRRVPVRFDNRSRVTDAQIQSILRQVRDPEVTLNVYDLGLVRRVEVDSQANISVGMVLTTPTCPNNAWLMGRIKSRLAESALFRGVQLTIIPDLSWSQDFITEEGSRTLLEMGKW